VNWEGEPDAEFDFVPNNSRPAPLRAVLSNNYAFGGNNCSLAIGKPNIFPREFAPVDPVDVVVTGIGAVGPLGLGVEAWWDAMTEGTCGIGEITSFDARRYGYTRGGEPPRLDSRGFAPSSAWRKMDALGRQCLASSRM